MSRARIALIALGLLLLFSSSVTSEEMRLGVVEHDLRNGMKILILERHTSPVVSFYLRFKVGSVDEHPGITGIAHLCEHMMFKGTENVSSWNYEAEAPLLAKIDSLAGEWRAELECTRHPLYRGDTYRVEQLREEMAEVQKQEKEYIIKDELWETYMKSGGIQLNASTGNDGTQYYVSLPANRVELWAYLESDRIANPIFREFYSERDVVNEERRLRTDDQPWGKLWEEFYAAAFTAHPYTWPVVGWASDIQVVMREEVAEFFRTYYAPNNAIAVIVGDVDAEEVIAHCEKYFGPVPAQEPPPPVVTTEPLQTGERRVTVEFDAEPLLAIGYHMPEGGHPDQAVLEVIASLLSRGKTSRFYQNIVEKKIATSVNAYAPLARYPELFTVTATPLEPHPTEEVEKAVYAEIEKLKTEPVTEWELEKFRNQLEVDFIRGMKSNLGMAWRLGDYQALVGDWRYLLQHKRERARVTSEDVLRVAREYLTESNRTVATLVKKEKETKMTKVGIEDAETHY
jgi:predicted Zn-dependent peptidase